MLDILCVGDAKFDIFLQISKDNPQFSLDTKTNKLSFNHGEKIYAEKHVLAVGGNATNTAVGLSRLGLNTGILAEIGKDEFSQKIINRLKDEHVNTDLLLQTKDEETSFSVAISYKSDRTIFTEHVKRGHKFDFDKIQTGFIYLTSMGPLWEKAYEKILEYVEKNQIKLAFNPGTLQIETKSRVVMNIIEKTEYLFVNKQEAEKILYGEELDVNLKTESSIKKLLFGLKSFGVKNVIITDSQNGSYAIDNQNNFFKLGTIDANILEKTGAGDAFATGFLAASIYEKDLANAMVWGSINAASVIEHIGAQEGLLTKQKLEDKEKDLQNFSPKNLE